MLAFDSKTEALIHDLPDANGARLLLARLTQEHPRATKSLLQDAGLLSDVLALASWSPFLATTIEQSPTYISWLGRERLNSRVRSKEELRESLARFALTNSLPPHVLLARFRRRELLRTYLHDIRGIHTVVETTEELSNLADAILEYALALARQDLDNRYGAPQSLDDHGRVATADFCIVALGKLGSFELNYASDIDLFFLYSHEGETSGGGVRDLVSNREYFVKLGETITRVVGKPEGEGAAYRVDLRLRPFGRDGALASSLDEAIRYYSSRAQQWELQALIRARASAGAPDLFSTFIASVRPQVFREEVSIAEALASVRIAKKKIDQQERERGGAFNVKLGRGGIREIEFIAQALQLAYGGKDPWLRAPHTLVTLGRLADRGLITDDERTQLSDAYDFLRRVEHRVQMEHGLQIHLLPSDLSARQLLARRLNFVGDDPLRQFDAAVESHTSNTRRAYDRVFAEVAETAKRGIASPQVTERVPTTRDTARKATMVATFAARLNDFAAGTDPIEQTGLLIAEGAFSSLNPHRSSTLAARVAASLDKWPERIELSSNSLRALMQVCGASEFLGEMVAANPSLLEALGSETVPHTDFRVQLRTAIDREKSFSAELSMLRRTWSCLLLQIGRRDIAREITLAEANRLQTELAVASINVAYLIARREMVRRFGNPAGGPRLAVLGLGRLASHGVDYGSDLDLVLIYDSAVRSPYAMFTCDEAYARLGELIVSALASITRTGHLYHVDLRLRPHGNDGPLANSSDAFIEYAKQQAAIWEWLAYVKLRAVAADLEFGQAIEARAKAVIHERAAQASDSELKSETRRVRDRLEAEQAKPARRGSLDIKYGRGGMLDVYFATRYLQLQHDVRDEGDDRSTLATLARLKSGNYLDIANFDALYRGYILFRKVDHALRLSLGRQSKMPPLDHPSLSDMARQSGYKTASNLIEDVSRAMAEVRLAYERILADG